MYLLVGKETLEEETKGLGFGRALQEGIKRGTLES